MKTKSIKFNINYDIAEITKFYSMFDSLKYGSDVSFHMTISDEKRSMKVCLEEYDG